MKILVIEDKVSLTDAIAEYLKQKKNIVTIKNDGEKGFVEARDEIYDVIVLDIMLPHKNGLDILKDLRANKNETPIILLSALSEIDDKIRGLNLGADDYLAKPFSLDELYARILASTRRKGIVDTSDSLTFGDIILNKNSHELKANDEVIQLGIKEYEILSLLIEANPKQVNKEFLTIKIWGYDSDTLYNNVEVYVSFLRRKLKALKSNVTIKSIRSMGYILDYEKN
jgi:DNA-binding response OmpR family regulator